MNDDKWKPKLKDAIIYEETEAYCASLSREDHPPYRVIASDLVNNINNAIIKENKARRTNDIKSDLRRIDVLPASSIAMVLMATQHMHRITFSDTLTGTSFDLIATYMDHGKNEGIYVCDDDYIDKLITQIHFTANKNVKSEVHDYIYMLLDPCKVTEDADLIAVNNGIFNFKTKELEPFSSDYVFLSKIPVDYNPYAKNVTIINPEDGSSWDVESWMKTLSSSSEVTDFLWQVIGAVLRPFVPFNKAFFLSSATGNNGKGTFCELLRGLVGSSSVSIPLSQFGENYGLEPLIGKTSVIVDETDVGSYLEKCGNFKAAVTGDVITVNRKFKRVVNYRFKGRIVMCVNDNPRLKDKGNSVFRRIVTIPFDQRFEGNERKYIKSDYVHRKEVREYVLNKVMHMDFYELTIPKECKRALEEYKIANDPVRQFLADTLPRIPWTLVPYSFLYEAYKIWNINYNSSGNATGRNKFIDEVYNIISTAEPDYPWMAPPKNTPISAKGKIWGDRFIKDEFKTFEFYQHYFPNDGYNPSSTLTLRGIQRKINTAEKKAVV